MNKINLVLASMILLVTECRGYGETQPKFTLTPITPTTIQLPSAGVATVKYQVTNNTKVIRTLTILPVQGINQISDGINPCTPPAFTLGTKQSCLLTLRITASQMFNGSILGGPQICKTKGGGNNLPDPFFCSQPSATYSLNITLLSTPSSVSRRVAVGIGTIAGTQTPIAYTSTDGGMSWSNAKQLPLTGGTNNILSSIACSSSGLLCSTVGSYINAGLGSPLSYTSSDGGNTWSSPILPSATLPGGTNYRLGGVSCSSSGLLCSAVGSYNNSGLISPLSYTSSDGGNTWSLPILPSTTIPGGTNYRLTGVSCSSSGLLCSAVGSYRNASNFLNPLAYTSSDGGNTWSPPILPPPPAGGTTTTLAGVSCSSSGLLCSTIGFSTIAGVTLPFAYTSTNGGNNWTEALFLTIPIGLTDSKLAGVSCDSSGLFCSTVGYATVASALQLLTYQSTDGGLTWGSQNSPTPPSGVNDNTLNGVFCDQTGLLCSTVGSGDIVDNVPYAFYSNNGGITWGNVITLDIAGLTFPNVFAVSGSK